MCLSINVAFENQFVDSQMIRAICFISHNSNRFIVLPSKDKCCLLYIIAIPARVNWAGILQLYSLCC